MAERTEELRQEIEQTRDHLGGTLDAIGDRVIPGRVVERKVNKVRQSLDRARTTVMGAKDQGADRGRARVGAVTSTVGDTAGSLADTAGSLAGSVKHAPEAVQHGTQGNPLVAGALAFGVGVLVASLLPPTEAEQSMAAEVAEPLKQELTDMGKQVASTAQSSAQDAAEEAKSTLTDATAEVKDQATGAVQEVKATSQDAAADVKSTAADQTDRAKDQLGSSEPTGSPDPIPGSAPFDQTRQPGGF